MSTGSLEVDMQTIICTYLLNGWGLNCFHKYCRKKKKKKEEAINGLRFQTQSSAGFTLVTHFSVKCHRHVATSEYTSTDFVF